MDKVLNPLGITWLNWGITLVCALITGMSKSGLKGMAMITIPILAHIYGGKASTGILLPFLIFGDIFAVITYRGNVQWKYIKKLIPWAIIGIIVALYVGETVSDNQFKMTIAVAILLCLIIIIYNDFIRKNTLEFDNNGFSISLGLSGGFATMMGNAAGPIFNLYLLSMKLPKAAFIGTGAWFYLMLNLFKVPLHVYSWGTIRWETIQFNFVLLPVLALGGFIGKYIVKLIPEKGYRYFVLLVTGVSSILLFI